MQWGATQRRAGLGQSRCLRGEREGTAAACALLSLLCISGSSSDGKKKWSRPDAIPFRLDVRERVRAEAQKCAFLKVAHAKNAFTEKKEEKKRTLFSVLWVPSAIHHHPHHRCRQPPHSLCRHSRIAEITFPSSNRGKEEKGGSLTRANTNRRAADRD